MALGGGDGSDGLLIGPIMEWWDKHTARRDARRAARLEAKAAKRRTSSPATSGKPPAEERR